MEVKDFVELLKNFDRNSEVLITWEGIFQHIGKSNIYYAQNKLIIDADGNSYKDDILSGRKKAQ